MALTTDFRVNQVSECSIKSPSLCTHYYGHNRQSFARRSPQEPSANESFKTSRTLPAREDRQDASSSATVPSSVPCASARLRVRLLEIAGFGSHDAALSSRRSQFVITPLGENIKVDFHSKTTALTVFAKLMSPLGFLMKRMMPGAPNGCIEQDIDDLKVFLESESTPNVVRSR